MYFVNTSYYEQVLREIICSVRLKVVLLMISRSRLVSRMCCPTGIQEVAGSILGPAIYLS